MEENISHFLNNEFPRRSYKMVVRKQKKERAREKESKRERKRKRARERERKRKRADQICNCIYELEIGYR